MTTTRKIAFLLGTLLFSLELIKAQCGLNHVLPITDLGTQYGYIRVDNATNNDLSAANQGVCEINIRFRHAGVGDINLFLSSPNGVLYRLIGAGGSRSTSGTVWDIRFVACNQDPSPDQGNFIKPRWDSDQAWGENQTYSGSYHAEICLEDINTGPVNGIWTVTVSDVNGMASGTIEAFSLQFCDQQGVSCSECVRAGGTIIRDTTFVCGGEPSLGAIRIFPTYSGIEPDPNDYAYRFVVVHRGRIVDIAQLPDLLDASAGDYLIYGISVANEDLGTLLDYIGQAFSSLTNALAANRLGFCAAFSSGIKVYRILSDPDPRNVVNQYVCPESPIIFDGNVITTAGVYTATLTSSSGCDSIVELHVADFRVNNQIADPGVISCNSKPLTLSWSNNQFATNPSLQWYTADGSILSGERTSAAQIDLPGRYNLKVALAGCADTLTIDIASDGSLPTLLIGDTVMTCSANIGKLRPDSDGTSFNWSGPFGYSSTEKNIDVYEPGQYTVTAIGPNCAVRKTVQVRAEFNRPQNVTASGGAIRCDNDSVQLSASSTSANINYRWSGPNSFRSDEQNPWVTQGGIYTVQIGAGGCTEVRQVEVHNLFESPSVSIIGATLDCRNASKRITTTINDNRASFLWSGPGGYTSTERSPLVSLPGRYEVIVSDVNQCLYSAAVTVSVDTVRPTVSVSDMTVADCMSDDFTLGVNSYTSLHPATFRWTGPNNFTSNVLNSIATQAGIYTIAVIDPDNGCIARASMEVFPNPGQPVLMTKTGFLNCEQPEDILAVYDNCTGGCIYEWSGPSGFSDNNDSVTVTRPGDYQVKVTDINTGCYSWAGFLVRKDTVPLARDVRIIPIGCTTDGSIRLDNLAQIRQYEWQDTLTKEVMTMPMLTTGIPRVYSLKSKDINGCIEEKFYEVHVMDDVPLIRILGDSLDCARDSVVLGATISNYALNQVVTYDWTLPNGGFSNRPNPRVGNPGLITLRVLLRNGCKGLVQSVIETDYTEPVLNAVGGGFACRDTGIILQLSADRPPLSAYWTGPDGFQSYNMSPQVRTPGVYSLEIIGANGCLASDTALVYYTDPIPTLMARRDTIDCYDTAGDLSFTTDAAPGYTFRWLDPGGRTNLNNNITTTLHGPYQIELTDSNGCRVIARTEIEIDTISIGHTITSQIISCNDSITELQLDTVYGFLSYQWSFDSVVFSNLAQPVVDTGGLFILTTTNINGCQRQIMHQVEADTIRPVFTLPADTLNCESDRITLRATPTTGSWRFAWSGPGSYSSDRANALIVNPGRYTLTTTAVNGCSRTVATNIEASFEVPEIQIDSTFLPCNSDTAQLSFASNDVLKETNWFGPNGFYQSTPGAGTTEEGWYYLLAKGVNGCEAFDSQYVSSIPLLEPLQLSMQKIDCANPLGFVSIDRLSSGYSYLIIDQNNDTLPTTSVQTASAQDFTVLAEHLASGCIISQMISIPADTMPPQLTIVRMDSIICEHREIRLGSEVDTAVLYEWNTIDGHLIGPVNNHEARLDVPGTYELTVKSIANDCISVQSVLVEEVFSNLSGIFVTGIPASCDGRNDAVIIVDSLQGGSAPYTFSLDDEFYTSQNIFQFLEPQLYSFIVKDINGCTYDTLVTVERYPTFNLDLGDPEIIIDLGDSLLLQASTSLSNSDISQITWWLPDSVSCLDCLTQIIRPLENSTFYVGVTSTYGCLLYDTLFVRVADPGGVFVPNAFTPDGDGINDHIEVFAGDNIEHITAFEIFDRWGNNVFSAFDFTPGETNARWNGTYKGEELNPGVYIYLAQVRDIRGRMKTKAGDITLIR